MTDELKIVSNFDRLMNYAKAMHKSYFFTLSAFYSYEALLEAIVEKENSKVIGDFKDFFLPTLESLRVYFFLELAKMLDHSDQSLHINKILNFTESNLKSLTADAFVEYNKNQDRVFTEELAANYRGIDYNNFLSLKQKIEERQKIIEDLKIYRNKWLAHDDINKPAIPNIGPKEIRDLFNIIETILNFITGELNSESWMYSHIEEDTKYKTKLVIEYLNRFEPYRIKEIEKEIEEEMKQYKISKNNL